MQKIIIGIAGESASGKGTVGKHMAEKYGALSLQFSQPLRDILDRIGLEQNRENLAKISLYLRKAFGEDILSKSILKEAEKSSSSIVVVDGVRRLSDIIHMETNEHFYFVYVEVSSEKRYERLIKRRQNVDDATKTPSQFDKDAKLESESQVRDLKARADFIVNNDGTLEELQAQVHTIVEELKKR